jgi:hypothetical protein
VKGGIMIRTLVAFVLLGAMTSSHAVTTGGQPPGGARSAAVQAPIKHEAAKAMADDSSGLRKGTLEAVDIAHGTFHVYGQPHTFDVAKVRVFGRDGKATSAYALRRGAAVRFTLDPADATQRRVAVIYLD